MLHAPASHILTSKEQFPKFPAVFKRLGHVLLIVALLAAVGGHWALLQTVAWTNMLADNLRATSLAEAMQRTFDGKHPCALCKEIAAGKKSEKKTEFLIELKKLEFVSERVTFVFNPPQNFHLLPDIERPSSGLSYKPLLPPPRPLLG